MLRVVQSIVIKGPPAKVFAVAADPHTQLAWDAETLKRVEALTPGPLARGSRYRGVFKGLGTLEYEFTEYEAGRRFAHDSRIPMGHMRHVFAFEAVPDGTRLTQTAEVKPNLLGWMLRPVMARLIRTRFRVIGDEIVRYLARTPTENGAPAH